MHIIFAGNIGRSCIGGKAWANMQYLAGLMALNHDVFYLEDCGDGSWVYNWDREEITTDLEYPADYVHRCLKLLGLESRWIYRAGNLSQGMDLQAFQTVCSKADLMIVWADPLTVWREDYDRPQRKIFIDVDPGFTQMSLINGHAGLTTTCSRCDRLFTISQRMGKPDCLIPSAGYQWLRTLPPVALPSWSFVLDNTATHFTAVMSWRGFRDISYQGKIYGQKDREFPKFIELPLLSQQPFMLAQIGAEPDWLETYGWQVTLGWEYSLTPHAYQNFIQNSRAEFGVAKQGYVKTRGGWFSDRSVCYLASGRPVLLQDTGLIDWLPTGEGVLTFNNIEQARQAVELINVNYERHRQAARAIAEEYFSAVRVLPRLVEAAMSSF